MGMFTAMQWRLSDKQIKKLKSDILETIDGKYKSRIDKLEDTLEQHKQYQTNMALLAANSLNDKFFALERCDDPLKQGTYSNDIINTIENIFKNDMVGDLTKALAMSFVHNNIETAQRIGRGSLVNSIYDFIMKDKDLKKYYLASQHFFDELGKNKTPNDK